LAFSLASSTKFSSLDIYKDYLNKLTAHLNMLLIGTESREGGTPEEKGTRKRKGKRDSHAYSRRTDLSYVEREVSSKRVHKD
jgi:hypothetical protein